MSHDLIVIITTLVVAVVNYYIYFALFALYGRTKTWGTLKVVSFVLFLALTAFEMIQTKPFLQRGSLIPEDVTLPTGLIWLVIILIPAFLVKQNYQKLER